jgi:hypothetical protein
MNKKPIKILFYIINFNIKIILHMNKISLIKIHFISLNLR